MHWGFNSSWNTCEMVINVQKFTEWKTIHIYQNHMQSHQIRHWATHRVFYLMPISVNLPDLPLPRIGSNLYLLLLFIPQPYSILVMSTIGMKTITWKKKGILFSLLTYQWDIIFRMELETVYHKRNFGIQTVIPRW